MKDKLKYFIIIDLSVKKENTPYFNKLAKKVFILYKPVKRSDCYIAQRVFCYLEFVYNADTS